jgi:hypothetical protein
MRKKVKRCECLGGPLDGRVMKVDGPVIYVEMNGDDGRHFYRLCACSLWDERRPDEMRWATYYHYLGEKMTDTAPKLIPHRRMFK